MTLHLIHEELYFGVAKRLERFKDACNKYQIGCHIIDSRTTDYLNLPVLSKKDLLYKVSDGNNELESLLLNNQVTTFYSKNPVGMAGNGSTDLTLIHTKHNIAQPKTIFHNNTIDRELLKGYVNYLNGFPLVIKMYGKSRGIGLIKVDSWQALISAVDYLHDLKKKFILREFIRSDHVIRLMVLGQEVIASWFTPLMDDDFRNVSDESLSALTKEKIDKKYAQEIENLAVAAVHMCGLEFGAVDIILDEKDNAYVLEVNFPCGLSFDPSGENFIVEKMVTYLIQKADKYNYKI
jgi:hypothetical protein